MTQWVSYNLDDINSVAREILQSIPRGTAVYVYGDLGAGKTTLMRHIMHHIGVIDQVSSPTYSLVNIYQTADRATVYHADLYRLESIDEALDIDIESYLYPELYTFVEWPQVIEALAPEGAMELRIEASDMGHRTIILEALSR